MPTIDLGVNFEDVKDSDLFPVVPNGTYPFLVKSVEAVNAQNGRPMLKWKIEIIDPTDGKAVNLFINAVLPWTPPGESELTVTGLQTLVGICKATGVPWTGKDLNTEDYVGRNGTGAKVVQKLKQEKNSAGEYVDNTDGVMVNEVKGFVY
uniref:DUF669 domain-containing protein n=1 Tax=viral metagenome TaxID=1070528 RepID=A0A6M3IH42_9ZZZZ